MGGDSDDEELPGLEEVDTGEQDDEEDREGDLEVEEVQETDEEELGKSPVNYH